TPTTTTNAVNSRVCSRIRPKSGVSSAAKLAPPTERVGLPLISVPRVARKIAWNSGKITKTASPSRAGTQNTKPSTASLVVRDRRRPPAATGGAGDLSSGEVVTVGGMDHLYRVRGSTSSTVGDEPISVRVADRHDVRHLG